EEGTYTVRWSYTKDAYITEGYDCAWLDQVVFDVGTGLPLSNLEEVRIFPNPFRNQLTVINGEKVKSVTFINLLGQRIIEIENRGEEVWMIPTGSLPKGVYMLQLKGYDGSVLNRKMVKE
ncbi:MAG: T9SS type A sorting domain-containing protein, partial [bacterium]